MCVCVWSIYIYSYICFVYIYIYVCVCCAWIIQILQYFSSHIGGLFRPTPRFRSALWCCNRLPCNIIPPLLLWNTTICPSMHFPSCSGVPRWSACTTVKDPFSLCLYTSFIYFPLWLSLSLVWILGLNYILLLFLFHSLFFASSHLSFIFLAAGSLIPCLAPISSLCVTSSEPSL